MWKHICYWLARNPLSSLDCYVLLLLSPLVEWIPPWKLSVMYLFSIHSVPASPQLSVLIHGFSRKTEGSTSYFFNFILLPYFPYLHFCSRNSSNNITFAISLNIDSALPPPHLCSAMISLLICEEVKVSAALMAGVRPGRQKECSLQYLYHY